MSSDWKGRGGGRPGSQPTLSDSTAAQGDSGANPPGWAGRGGGRYRSQSNLSDATAHHGDTGASQSGWAGRGGGKHRPQPNLSDATAHHGDAGASPSGWAGRGGGRYRPQLSLSASTSHHGDAGASQSGWAGRGGGRHRPQPNLSDSSSHYGDAGAAPSGWAGRGGGRHRPQPNLVDSTAHHGDFGASQSGWAGRGGGRHRPQPILVDSTAHHGDDGASPSGWAGRGGGRHRPQPKISSAIGMMIQRGVQNAVAQGLSKVAQKVGMGFAARTLFDPVGAYVFSLEIDGVELAHFQDCSGIKSGTEIFEVKEGGVNHAIHKLSGQSTWDNLVLSYGVTSNSSMLSLRDFIVNDDYSSSSIASFKSPGGSGSALPKRFNGSIVIRNNKFQELVRYNFMNAWVVSWEGPKLDSNNSSLAISKVEIAHHGIEVARGSLMVTGWV